MHISAPDLIMYFFLAEYILYILYFIIIIIITIIIIQ